MRLPVRSTEAKRSIAKPNKAMSQLSIAEVRNELRRLFVRTRVRAFVRSADRPVNAQCLHR